MKSKAPLAMMEQIIMVLVFAIASAVCLQIFVLSEKLSEQTELENLAVLHVQNAAEQLKALGPEQFLLTWEAKPVKDGWQIFLDADWQKTEQTELTAYYLELCPQEETLENFWNINVRITKKDGTELFCLPVAGQREVKQK